jgi:hypothetical protein
MLEVLPLEESNSQKFRQTEGLGLSRFPPKIRQRCMHRGTHPRFSWRWKMYSAAETFFSALPAATTTARSAMMLTLAPGPGCKKWEPKLYHNECAWYINVVCNCMCIYIHTIMIYYIYNDIYMTWCHGCLCILIYLMNLRYINMGIYNKYC